MTNQLKGQTKIELGRKSYECRLSIDALIQIEEALDQGILEITQDISDAKIRLGQMATILLYALQGAGNKIDEGEVKELIQATGIVPTCTQVAELLVATLSDPESEGDPEAKKDKEVA